MSPFVKRVVLTAALVAACALPALAQVEVDPWDVEVTKVQAAVVINGESVAKNATIYYGNDGTVYAGSTDLTAWGLKYPVKAAFTRGDVAYYGLQSQLALAVSLVAKRLTIVAPAQAFIGAPNRVREGVTPGGGASVDYKIGRSNGQYRAFFSHDADALEVGYLSRKTEEGLSFYRELTRLYRLDVDRLRVVQLGEGNVTAGQIGTSTRFAGLHVASAFRADPLFTTGNLPSVTGVAATDSIVEVYVDNVLQWRAEVPAGPFVVRNLPPEAAGADVVLVLTDAAGVRTTQAVRPVVDLGFLRPGLTSYAFDAGWGRNVSAFGGSPRYDKPLASMLLRHGVVPWITLQGLAQTVAGDTFAALGVEARPARGQQLVFWYGEGRVRHTGWVNYDLNAGKFQFTEELRYNAQSSNPFFEPGGVVTELQEQAKLTYNPSYDVTLRAELDRNVNSNGFPTTVASFEGEARIGRFGITLRPTYNRITHLVGATVTLRQRLGDVHDLREGVARPARRPASTTLQFDKRQSGDDDRWGYKLEAATGESEMRGGGFEVRMPWAEARGSAEDQNGQGNVQAELSGALALVGNGLHASDAKYEDRTFGVARMPGFPGVHISVNGQPEGVTDNRGIAVLRNLAALSLNEITADVSQVPLAVGVRSSVSVEPLPQTPVTVDLLDPKAQSLIVRVVDAGGAPLPPASVLFAENGTRFPIGFEGRAYVHGLSAGRHVLSTRGAHPCALELALEPRWEIVDAGTAVCRPLP